MITQTHRGPLLSGSHLQRLRSPGEPLISRLTSFMSLLSVRNLQENKESRGPRFRLLPEPLRFALLSELSAGSGAALDPSSGSLRILLQSCWFLWFSTRTIRDLVQTGPAFSVTVRTLIGLLLEAERHLHLDLYGPTEHVQTPTQ